MDAGIIVSLVGAFGVGAIAAKLLDATLIHSRTEAAATRRWLRDQRLKAYTTLSHHMLSRSRWSGAITYDQAYASAAEAAILAEPATGCAILEFFEAETKAINDFQGSGLAPMDPKYPEHEETKGRQTTQARDQLDQRARTLFDKLRTELLGQ